LSEGGSRRCNHTSMQYEKILDRDRLFPYFTLGFWIGSLTFCGHRYWLFERKFEQLFMWCQILRPDRLTFCDFILTFSLVYICALSVLSIVKIYAYKWWREKGG
jgi:hypothetical protein